MIRGSSRRYTYMRFRSDMTLEVVLPRRSKVDVQKTIEAKLGWIAREYERMAGTKRVLGPDEVMFSGSCLRIVFSEGARDELVLDMAAGEVVVTTNDRRRVKELVRRWFLKETSAYVVKKVSELAPSLGVRPSRVDVREIGKWGYCTRGGRLSFSWQLIALPEVLREYVVLHELAHLAEFNHSPAFRRTLSSVCPDFRQRERDLDRVLPYDHLTLM